MNLPSRRLALRAAATLAAWPTVSRAQQGPAPILRGAGSTLAAPLYAALGQTLGAQQRFELDYAAVGSGEGLRRLAAREVDFAASEQALARADLDARGLVQLPVIVGGFFASANLPGVAAGALRLDGPLLADLMLGRIARWNDPRLRAMNPGLALPALPVSRVVRQDASGTSLLFTRYLSRVSPEFARAPGASTTPLLEGAVAARGNGGVARAVVERPGAIGYMEHAFATENQLPTIGLRNRFGEFVSSTPEHIAAAVRAADWELMYIDSRPSFEMDTVDAGCPRCWPMVGLSYVIAPTRWADPARAAAFVRFVESIYDRADELLRQERYVPLPSRARNLARVTLRAQMRPALRG
jgi:phosphate transport system substrate-binding protein